MQLSRFEIRLSGTGGQGVLTLGRILGHGLALEHGYYVTQTQSYGPEARGGASRADLVVNSEPINYPKPEQLDFLVALSQEACNRYFQRLKPTGRLFVDTSLVLQTPSNQFWGIPCTDIAREKIGLVQATNIVALGALTHLLPFVRRAAMKRSLEANLPGKILEVNLKAFSAGYNQARKDIPEGPEQWTFS
ncbi:MAG: 2-oxoacid:acceptor oxidoreductase family protein [Thermodesulfobacteriota bacterium]